MAEFLAVPHHQLVLGLITVALLQAGAWAHGAARARAAKATLSAAVSDALMPLETRLEAIEHRLASDLAQARMESAESAGALRVELQQSLTTLGESQRAQLDTFAERLRVFEAQVAEAQNRQRELLDARLGELRDVFVRSGREQREEMRTSLENFATQQRASTEAAGAVQKERLASFEQRLTQLTATLTTQLEALREENGKRLEDMRKTVDEKLQSTLEKRLGESFRLVSERLESVHKGLGEMQELATGVGDLRRVLTNVKTRGTWGEVQLGRLLEDVLTNDQYGSNVAVKPGSSERVEFAIRLPGRDAEDAPVWLPIDAKFPREDYERLLAASEAGNPDEVETAVKALEQRVLGEAREIASKYLAPPHTTDFGILYLPTEGLYAEIARREGLTDRIQREHRVVVAGPNTFSALLNSLQMGFRTLAIQQRSGEVWQVLGAVKTEFGKFGEALDKVKNRLRLAEKDIGGLETRTRVMTRRLKGVEAIPTETSARILDFLDTEGDLDNTSDAPPNGGGNADGDADADGDANGDADSEGAPGDTDS